MDLGVRGKIALVLGAGGGLVALSPQVWPGRGRISLSPTSTLGGVEASIKQSGVKVLALPLDLADPSP